MSSQSREAKLQQRHMNKSLSRPFKKRLEKDQQRIERQRIRDAKRAKYDSGNDDSDQSYEGK